MSINPIEDRVIVKAIKKEETVSGLVIPDTIHENNQTGEVVAVGPGKYEKGQLVPNQIQVGDKVIYAKHQAAAISHKGEDLYVLSPASVLAVIADE